MSEVGTQNSRTKILATLGPSTNSVDSIKDLIDAGVNGVRLNMSHGNYQFFDDLFINIHTACTDKSSPLSVLVDLQGPKIRIGELVEPKIEIESGKTIRISVDGVVGNQETISSSYKNLKKDAHIDDLILIDDGLIRLKIIGKEKEAIVCRIEKGGTLSPRKGINLPGMKLSTPSLTNKDFKDLEYILEKHVDFIALSFVRSTNDIIKLKKWLEENGKSIPVIAKIEKKEACDDFESIIKVSDGIMIARGDLGVELSPSEVPVIQKEIIKKCNQVGKLVITATQMLESMINSQIPTRAEASDVANAVWDGTDVVMLSGETSIGKYPLNTVRTMRDIIKNAEGYSIEMQNINYHIPEKLEENLFDSVCKGITNISEQINASAIVVFTYKGRAARGLAKYRPKAKIIAISNSFETMNRLSLRWGVTSTYMEKIDKENIAINNATELILESELVKKGDLIIFLSQAPLSEKGRTEWTRFEVL